MIPTFKQLIRADNTEVFMNFEEFGEYHNVGGKDMLCIIDGNELIDRERRYQFRKSLYADGIYLKELLIYVREVDMGALPAIGRSLTFDKKTYIVADAVDEDGIYSITMEANKSS